MNNCGWVRNGGKCILEQENKKYKEVIDKIRKEINEEHSIMGVEVVENWVLLDILKEVSE